MAEKELAVCDECGSLFFKGSSQMMGLCPECAHVLYGYPNCPHRFLNGRCVNCYWDGSKSEYIQKHDKQEETTMPTTEWLNKYESVKNKLACKTDLDAHFTEKVIGTMGVDVLNIGAVRFPTGMIFACDPMVELEDTPPFIQTIPAGTYPVKICVVPSKKYGDRYACVKVEVSQEKPVRYELGMTGKEDLDEEVGEDEYFGFGVDAGMGCVADIQTQAAFKTYWAKRLEEDPDIDPYNDLFCDLLEENAKAHPKYQGDCGDWLNWTVPDTDCNLPIFASGWGDGYYPVYFGYDAKGEVCAVYVRFIDIEASYKEQAYQRIAVLVSLDAIHSDLLPQYLEQAKQDGRRYLLEHAKRIEGELTMNEKLSRPQFNQMDTTEKQTLMESLAARYDMTFLGLHTFDRWGQSCTTGIFKKDGREFVFVPGDTVTLGWEQFAVGLNQESREELEYLFREWEMEPQNPEEMIRESMAPVRQAVIGPMLVGRELEELCWEPVKMDDPRLTAHPDWLKEFRDFAWSDSSSLTLHQSARIERTEDGFHTWIYHCTDYDALLAGLEKQGLSLPTADEWAYLCGGGCRTLFPWGDGLDYSMRLHWFEDMDEDENRPYDMEEPNFFGLSIAYDPYMREVVQADRLTTCGGDGGCNICGGLGPFLGFLPCSPHCKPEVQEDNELNGDYDFYRPIIRLENYD